jgi:hypothetical protein
MKREMYGADGQTITAQQANVLFKAYCQGILDTPAVEETVGIDKARFFALLRQYRPNLEGSSLTYQITAPARKGNVSSGRVSYCD